MLKLNPKTNYILTSILYYALPTMDHIKMSLIKLVRSSLVFENRLGSYELISTLT